MKNIPNIITSARLLAAILLVAASLWSSDRGMSCFVPLFAIGGISDLFDGYIARRFKWCTEFGARLDSISDLAIYTATIFFLWIHTHSALIQSGWLLLLALTMQIVHIIFALVKHRSYPSYHTNYSRLMAYFLFFGVLTFWFTKEPHVISVLIGAWMTTIAEGLIITAVLRQNASDLADIQAAVAVNKTLAKIAADTKLQADSKINQASHATVHAALDQIQTR